MVAAVDPVNFEKPYTKELEGVSTIYKSTSPQLNGQARLTPGYPAITATVVNTKIPAVTYANWFSYTTDFLSENLEIKPMFPSIQFVKPALSMTTGACALASHTAIALIRNRGWMSKIGASIPSNA